MEGIFKPPKSLVFDKNVHIQLDDFLRSLDIYLRATGMDKKDQETKVAILLNHAGEEAQRRFQTFRLSEIDRKDFNKVIEAFQSHCKLLRNEIYDRYKFFTRVQQEGESFDHFLTEVKVLAQSCNFGTLEDFLVRDKIVSGIRDLSLQERLLRQSNITLKAAEEHCRAAEISAIQVKELRNVREVDAVQVGAQGNKGFKHKRKSVGVRKNQSEAEDYDTGENTEQEAVLHLVKCAQTVVSQTILL